MDANMYVYLTIETPSGLPASDSQVLASKIVHYWSSLLHETATNDIYIQCYTQMYRNAAVDKL
jgi:hypothetical protein